MFEVAVHDLLAYLWSPPLRKPQSQVRTVSGQDRRDLVFPLDPGASPIWDRIRQLAPLAPFLCVEIKNYGTTRVGKLAVDQLADYLTDPIGKLGILVWRGTLSSSASRRANTRWCHDRRVVLFVGVRDLTEMCDIAGRGDDPAVLVRDKLELFNMQVE